MNDNTDNTDWLNDFPALNKLSKENPFNAPSNFFEEQQERIHSAIYADELKLKIPSAGFTVPDAYFENMKEQVLSVIQLEALRTPNESFSKSDEFFKEQQDIIAARIKINEYAEHGSGFSVPDNYFNKLADHINEKIGIKEALVQPRPAKVKNMFTKAAWKYAVAASVVVALTTGIFVKQYQAAHTVQAQLSNLSDEDIENYLNIHADSYDNHIILENSASDSELDIENQTAGADSNGTIIK
jgi:hypothetical protein